MLRRHTKSSDGLHESVWGKPRVGGRVGQGVLDSAENAHRAEGGCDRSGWRAASKRDEKLRTSVDRSRLQGNICV